MHQKLEKRSRAKKAFSPIKGDKETSNSCAEEATKQIPVVWNFNRMLYYAPSKCANFAELDDVAIVYDASVAAIANTLAIVPTPAFYSSTDDKPEYGGEALVAERSASKSKRKKFSRP